MYQRRNNIEFELILSLLKKDNHARGLSKLLKYPHATISRKLNRLLKENVLDFRREGKNKVFFIKNTLQARKYVFMAEHYKFLKLLKRYPELEAVFEDILKTTKERLVVLFGSYAKFVAGPESDIDIYIETNNTKVKKQVEMVNSKIRVKTGLFNINSKLIKEIIKNHVIVRGVEVFYEKTGFF
ncbi:MAG: nucleotidyltransferase domain-containing protein [Candidatus Diapherotrites archaeon]|nr:nucleotidyltransferase domain-containing protein [Candidatus Diapherotrites archaeon]